MKLSVIILILIIIALSVVDVVSNVLSFIPFIGGLFETLSETIIEITQVFLTIIIAIISRD